MGAAIGRGSTQSLVAGSHEAGVGWSDAAVKEGTGVGWRRRQGCEQARETVGRCDEERGVCVCVGDWTGDDEIAKSLR